MFSKRVHAYNLIIIVGYEEKCVYMPMKKLNIGGNYMK